MARRSVAIMPLLLVKKSIKKKLEPEEYTYTNAKGESKTVVVGKLGLLQRRFPAASTRSPKLMEYRACIASKLANTEPGSLKEAQKNFIEAAVACAKAARAKYKWSPKEWKGKRGHPIIFA